MTEYPTEKSTGDLATTSAMAAVNLIPCVGGAVAELLDFVVTPSLQQRRDKFFELLNDRVKVLESDNESLVDKLNGNEQFVDVVVEASRIAIGTSNETKRNALASAVINTAKGETPDEAVITTYLRLIRDWTEWHIKLMSFFYNPIDWFDKNRRQPNEYSAASKMRVLKDAFPELDNKEDMVLVWWQDIYHQGFTRVQSLSGTATGRSLYDPCLTSRGNEFLRFIASHD